MINLIQQEIKKFDDVTYYQITKEEKESYELYFVHHNLETYRNVKTTTYNVKIFNLHGSYLGSSDFTIFTSDDINTINKKINDALVFAKLVNNEPYLLPKAEILEEISTSNFQDYSLEEAAKIISEACFKAETKKEATINALEIFVNKTKKEIINSNGLDKKVSSYNAFVEAIPTFTTNNESVEIYESFRFSSLNPKDITLRLLKRMEEVEYRSKALRKQDNLNVKVALNSNELKNLFFELANEVNAASIYNHANKYQLGDILQTNDEADKLNITLKAEIEGSVFNQKFDNDGTTLVDTNVIKDGKYVNSHGSIRYSYYLKQEPTGDLRNIEVAPGSLDISKLTEDYFECVSLSGLQLDLYNDYIGGEIRLGYLHKENEIIPLTSMSFSAKLSEVLNHMKLSKNIVNDGTYSGPDLALFDKVQLN